MLRFGSSDKHLTTCRAFAWAFELALEKKTAKVLEFSLTALNALVQTPSYQLLSSPLRLDVWVSRKCHVDWWQEHITLQNAVIIEAIKIINHSNYRNARIQNKERQLCQLPVSSLSFDKQTSRNVLVKSSQRSDNLQLESPLLFPNRLVARTSTPRSLKGGKKRSISDIACVLIMFMYGTFCSVSDDVNLCRLARALFVMAFARFTHENCWMELRYRKKEKNFFEFRDLRKKIKFDIRNSLESKHSIIFFLYRSVWRSLINPTKERTDAQVDDAIISRCSLLLRLHRISGGKKPH